MKSAIYVAAACSWFALPIGPAQAGACTGEIENLTKAMAARDAGSGPTSGAAVPVPGSGRSSDTQQHPPTGRLSQEAEGKATSPEDVRRQTGGQPTAAEQAQSGRPTATPDHLEASAALARARDLDRGGKEAECMAEIQQAKRLSGM
jgi:hypothetical protein